MATREKILIVDDDPNQRDIPGFFLEDAGYLYDTAPSGEDGLELLSKRPTDWDAILLDRTMPGIEGIEVVRRLKRHEVLRHVPVIMQTAIDGEKEIAEGIDAGVFYYLVKPIDRNLLLSITQAAVRDCAGHRALMAGLRQRSNALATLRSGRFTVRTLNEANDLATALAATCPDPPSTAIGLSELLINAIEHGNLAIGGKEKANLLAAHRWSEEVERRLALPQYRDRFVTVTIERLPEALTVQIADMGSGFDWRPYEKMDRARVFGVHGRGIALARAAGFSSLEYRGAGNVVVGVVGLAP